MAGHVCPHCGVSFGSLEGFSAHERSCAFRDKAQPVVVTPEPAIELSEPESDVPEAVAEAIEAEKPNLHAMKRSELESLASKVGIESPSSLPNKGALIAAIEEAIG